MKHTIILLVLSFFASSIHGQDSKVFDNLSIKSKILKSDRKYSIYLPPGYETSERSYPVLYLLHGSGDDQSGWVQFGEVKYFADKAIREGKATPMIIVMPDANTGVRGYWNHLDGEWNYEDFFFEEFIPQIEKKYRIRSEKRYRAISGLSMGGGGTLMYALHRPDLFSSACPLSAWIGFSSVEDLKKYNQNSDVSYSEEQLTSYFKNYNAIELVKNTEVEKLNSVNWFIDCGDDDFLYEGNSLLHIEMKKREVKHEYRVRDGKHSWTYWRASLPVVLSFVSDTFHQH